MYKKHFIDVNLNRPMTFINVYSFWNRKFETFLHEFQQDIRYLFCKQQIMNKGEIMNVIAGEIK